eukprot:superscaffoldBa00003353_g16730
MEEDDVTIREQNFHSQVREYIICFLLFAVLYIVSYCIITRYKRKSDDHEDEDAVVNRISLYLCTFTLAMSGGAVFLLPFSIISNEILLSFPKNYYIQWLNGSLIHVLDSSALQQGGKWKLCEQGIRARILETFVMLFLLALLILGIVWVASALIDNDAASMESLYVCTPVGLSRMFTVMGQLLVKPTILEDLDEQIYCIHLQEEALQRRLNGSSSHVYTRGSFAHQLNKELDNIRNQRNKLERRKKASGWEKNLLYPMVMLILLAGTVSAETDLSLSPNCLLMACTAWLVAIGTNNLYLKPHPLKTISVIMVALNILYLLVDETAMPKGSTDRGIGNTSLSTFGVAQAVLEIILMLYPFSDPPFVYGRSRMLHGQEQHCADSGHLKRRLNEAALLPAEKCFWSLTDLLNSYLLVSSVVGFYSLRVFEGLTPRKDDTTMTTIIGCCVSILVLSSALPVMSRTLGITRFDLLGDFGRFNWLGNFYIVLSYNLLFAVVTTLCLVRKFTSAIREELLKALGLDKLQLSNSPTDPESGKLSANGHQKTL